MDHEMCPACRFDGGRYDDRALLAALRDLGPAWSTLLDEAGADLRVRPEAGVWSAIEYAAHSRDVTALHVFGVEQALTRDEPAFPPIGDDLVESAASTYGEADPRQVATDLGGQACRLADLAGDAGIDAWSRGITIGHSRSDVRRLLEHALHDSLHHLEDVEAGVSLIRRGGITVDER
jgi:DinB superfamily